MAYVIVSISIRCPFCGQTSVEHMVAETERFDTEQVARVLSRQLFDCQSCLRKLPDGTVAIAHAELATPSGLEQLGFPSSRGN
jgi:transposase-like protein